MDMQERPITWFHIPVADMARALAFYNRVFGLKMDSMDYQGMIMAFFPMADDQVGGALAQDPERTAKNGTMVYLNGGEDLSVRLAEVEPAGGKVTVPKTPIGEGMGYFAHFLDTEGNEVGMWSQN